MTKLKGLKGTLNTVYDRELVAEGCRAILEAWKYLKSLEQNRKEVAG